jgi:uncharacterized membrane protein
METNTTTKSNLERIATGLGWFSIGLGAAEMFSPGILSRIIGVRNKTTNRALLRFYGARELAAGVGILTQRQPAGWLWARVGGDMVDLSTLGLAFASSRTNKTKLIVSTAAVAGVTALDIYAGQQLTKQSGWGGTTREGRVRASRNIIIDRPPEEVYRFWRDLENAPRFMPRVESVQRTGEGTWRWTAKGPGGRSIHWESETVEDQPNSLLSWRSVKGSLFKHSGTTRFERAPGDRGTIVRVEMEYSLPAGAVVANLAKLFGAEPGQRLDSALRAAKQILETGDIVQSDASIHRGMHAAQPPADRERTWQKREAADWRSGTPSLARV